jgi:hypothetical protein
MKKSILMTAMFALLMGLAYSCDKKDDPGKDPGDDPGDDPGKDPVALTAPKNLVSSDVTFDAATLKWDAVETADSYNLRINDWELILVTSPTYDVEDLEAEMTYVWSVQAVRDKEPGPWSTEDARFTTKPAPIEIPGNLSTDGIGFKSAILNWDPVEGATGYEVHIQDMTPDIVVTENLYELSGLAFNGEFTWSVRTIAGEMTSEWSEEVTFSTTPVEPMAFEKIVVTSYLGALNGDGTSTIRYYMETANKYMLSIDMIATAVNDATNVQYIEIPAGTYPFSQTVAVNTIKFLPTAGFTYLYPLPPAGPPYFATGGVATVSGDSSNYHMEFVIETAQLEPMCFTWDGPFQFPNPNYIP